MAGGASAQVGLAGRNRVFVIALMAILVLGGLAGIATFGSGGAQAAIPKWRTLTVGIVNEQVTTVNPMQITLVDEFIIVYNIYSTLITSDKSYAPTPDLARSWSVSPDGTVWTFNLVHDAVFTDPMHPSDTTHHVTSADVVYSYWLNKNTTASIFNSYLTYVTNISAADPYTVQLTTSQPLAALRDIAGVLPVFPKYIWSAQSSPLNYTNCDPVGSGPMMFDVANATNGACSGGILFLKSPHYFGQADYCQTPRPSQVIFKDYTSAPLMVTDFKAGLLDSMISIDPSDYLNSLGPSGTNGVLKWAADTGFVGEYAINVMTNSERASLVASGLTQFRTGANSQILATNLTVRQAIAESIDKQALVNSALLGLGHVADTLVPDSNPWHYPVPANQTFKFNTSAARAKLNAAGWKYNAAGALAPTTTPLYQAGGTNPLIFRLYTLNTAPEWQVAVANISAWLSQTGIETTDSHGHVGYQLWSINQMSSAWFAADYDMWLWDWVFSPASDPSLDVMEVQTSMAIGPTSDNFYSNSTFDNIYNQSLVTLDHAARYNLTATLQKMVYNYASYILPYYRLDLYAANDAALQHKSTGWTNWGDWSKDVGLVPDQDLPALWFQVQPVDNPAPAIQSFADVSSNAGSTATISVQASDPDGDQLAFTWNFGDGTAATTTLTPSVGHTFASAGSYAVTVAVTDGEWQACGQATATVLAGAANQPPSGTLSVSYAGGAGHGTVNQPVTLVLNVSDSEGDPVNATWNFGDGSATVNTHTTNTKLGQNVQETHTYAAVGNYTVTVVFTDNRTGIGNHQQTQVITVIITAASTGGGGGGTVGGASNPWINYGIPLAIVVVVALAVAAVVLRRRSASKKEEEQSQRPPQAPPPPPPP